jgi:hypothetical protein
MTRSERAIMLLPRWLPHGELGLADHNLRSLL